VQAEELQQIFGLFVESYLKSVLPVGAKGLDYTVSKTFVVPPQKKTIKYDAPDLGQCICVRKCCGLRIGAADDMVNPSLRQAGDREIAVLQQSGL
jgi:hypothetical protein